MSVKETDRNETLEFIGDVLKFIVKLVYIIIRDSVLAFVPIEKKDLVDEVVVITGAGHGIGKQVAVNMARLGAKVVLWDINENGLKEAVKEIESTGGKASWYVCDVTSEKDVQRTATAVEKEVGDVMILINNAGIMQNVPMLELDSTRIKQTMDVNVIAHFWTIRAFLPSMEKNNKGHIVAIASAAGLVGHVNQIDYSASKFAVVGLMEAFSEELRLKDSNIKLTTVCPMTVNTGLNQNPGTRWSLLMPLISIDDAAKQIVDAIRKEKVIVTIPGSTLWFLAIAGLLPRQIISEVKAFTEYCQTPNNEKSSKKQLEINQNGS